MDDDRDRKLRGRVFALTWLSYASYYLTRKPLSVAKKALGDVGVGKAAVTHIDTSYLAAYAGGQFLSGWLGDKLGPKRVILAGMAISAACAIAFGLSGSIVVFMLVWALNGVAQSTGWSPNIKIMTAWFPAKGRGTVMGFWTTNYVVGGLVAGPIAAHFLAVRGAWFDAFIYPAFLVMGVGLLLVLFLPARRDAEPDAGTSAARLADGDRRDARARVLRPPPLWALGRTVFFMKLARYMLLFWLVYYMQNELHYSNGKATWIQIAFEAGGAVAAISIGYLSETLGGGRRIPIGVISLLLLAASLPLYAFLAPLGAAWNVLGLVLVGFFLFGPDALLSATAAQDLAGPAAAATAAGFINGMGSIGPVFGSESFSAITTKWGWSAGFGVLGAGALLSALILIPFWRRA